MGVRTYYILDYTTGTVHAYLARNRAHLERKTDLVFKGHDVVIKTRRELSKHYSPYVLDNPETLMTIPGLFFGN